MAGIEGGDLGRHLQPDLAIVLHVRRHVQLHAERLELDGHRLWAVGDWIGELAAGQEAGLLAGHGDQVGLGQGAHQALLFKRLQVGVDREGADVAGIADDPLGRRIADQAADARPHREPRLVGRGEVEAQLLHGGAVDLEDAHLDHHLLGRLDGEVRGDRLGGVLLGDVGGAGGRVHGRGLARQAHPPGEVGRGDVFARQRRGQVGLQAVGVVADPHVHHLHQPMLLVVDQEVGDPERLAAQVEALVGGGHQLQHVGLGHHDLADGIAETKGHRLVLGHHQGLGDSLHRGVDLGRRRRGGQQGRSRDREGQGGGQKAAGGTK